MSLLRQLIFAISFLFACLLAGNLIVSVYNTRAYLVEQLQVQADDTATSLGLTISQAAKDKDLPLLDSMVDVIFDRGYYRRIVYRSLSGESVVERHLPINVEGVPSWFIELIKLPQPEGKAEVVSGWFRLGELEVAAHPGYAYRDLWRVFNEQLWLFLVMAALCYALAAIGVRYLLRPLRKLEQQAEAICRREFPVQEELPRTPELRRMVVAMNRMVQKIKDMFQEQVELTESLYQQSYLDPVTGLSNRRDFDARLEALIKSEAGGGPGAILLLQVTGMQVFNDEFGREAGDQCLQTIAQVLREQTRGCEGAILSRRAGADFCAYVPSLAEDELEPLAEQLFSRSKEIGWLTQSSCTQLNLGVAYCPVMQRDTPLLSQADLALRQAQQRGTHGWQRYTEAAGQQRQGSYSAGEWRAILRQVVTERRVCLHYQPVYAADGQRILHAEVLCRVEDDGKLINAGVFWPMVERFNLGVELDQLMIEILAKTVKSAGSDSLPLCLNLSPRSVQLPAFVYWLEGFLQQRPLLAARLMFELPEHILETAETATRQFAGRLQACGASLSLDHFGLGTRAFNYLQSLPFACLKVDRSFVQHLDANPDNQFFIRSLVQIAHSCDVKILAEGVETAAEWQQIQALGLDGAQGYYLGSPSAALPPMA